MIPEPLQLRFLWAAPRVEARFLAVTSSVKVTWPRIECLALPCLAMPEWLRREIFKSTPYETYLPHYRAVGRLGTQVLPRQRIAVVHTVYKYIIMQFQQRLSGFHQDYSRTMPLIIWMNHLTVVARDSN